MIDFLIIVVCLAICWTFVKATSIICSSFCIDVEEGDVIEVKFCSSNYNGMYVVSQIIKERNLTDCIS